MTQRKLWLIAFALLAIPVGMAAAAYISANFATQRFVTVGGGAADSARFSVTSAIGQPATDVLISANFKVSGGFLHPIPPRTGADAWMRYE
jgi:hypothetical protein